MSIFGPRPGYYVSKVIVSLMALTMACHLLWAQHTVCPSFDIVNPEVSSYNMYAVDQGGGLIVAVGYQQIILSQDGGDTFIAANPGNYWFRDVIWTGIRFLACTDDGRVFSSKNGLNWTQRLQVDGARFEHLATSGEIFVVAGYRHTATTTDGITWTVSDLIYNDFNHIIWDGVFFKTVNYYNEHMVSVDGLNWAINHLGMNEYFTSFAYSGTLYMAPGEFNSYIYTSTSSTGWTGYPAPGITYTDALVHYANEQFFYTTFRGTWRSADGQAWEEASFNTRSSQLKDIIWTGTQYLGFGLGNYIFASNDGLHWTLHNGFDSNYSYGLTWDGEYFNVLTVSEKLWKSTDGSDWSSVPLPSHPAGEGVWWGNIAHNPLGTNLIVGSSEYYLYSPNGTDWSVRNNGHNTSFVTIDWLNNSWIAVDGEGVLWRSFDSLFWTPYNINPDGLSFRYPDKVAYHDGVYVVVGKGSSDNAFIATSQNLATWNYQLMPTVDNLYSVSWVGDRFLAGGNDGNMLQSFNGFAWTPVSVNLAGDVRDILYNSRDIFILDRFGDILHSETADGPWMKESDPAIPFAEKFAMNEQTMVVMASGTAIYTRECGLCYTSDETQQAFADWTQNLNVALLVDVLNSPCP